MANAVCSQGLCIAGQTTGTDANVDSPIDQDSGNDAGTDAPVPVECTTASDCPPEVGRPKLCGAGGKCVRITDPDALHGCDTIYRNTEDYKNPNAIIFGIYASIGNNLDDQGGGGAIVQALEEIGAASPPVVAIVCRKDRKNPVAVIEHLASLKVPLVIGQFETADIANITQLAKARGVAVWSTLGTSGLPSDAGTGDHMFYVQDDLVSTAAGFQEAFNLMQDRANPELPDDAGRPVTKVALLQSDNTDTDALLAALQGKLGGGVGTLLVNGAPLPESNTANFKKLVPNSLGTFDVSTLHNSADRPHIVIGLGGDSVYTAVQILELNWGAVQPRPHYILSARSKYNFVVQSNLNGPSGSTPTSTERARVIGVDFPGNVTKHTQYVQAFPTYFTQQSASAFDVLYDATWAAAFAYSVPVPGASTPRTSADLIKAFEAFNDPTTPVGNTVSPGPGKYLTGSFDLGSGKKVHFDGVSGVWAFQGQARRNPGVSYFCYGTDSSNLLYYRPNIAAVNANCQQP